MKQNQRKRILISVPMLAFQHRQGLEGILKYASERKSDTWETYLEAETLGNPAPINLNKIKCDGIIAYISDDKVRSRILAAQVPAVLYEPLKSASGLQKYSRDNVTFITSDFYKGGKMAARYFIERHFRHFAYVGSEGKQVLPGMLRQAGFDEELRRNGFKCVAYLGQTQGRQSSNVNDRSRLGEWLRKLPYGTGLFCVRDVRAIDVIAAAAASGISVPRHVAVLGFDNDELICMTCTPKLSSISADVSALGYEAAHQLDMIMSGGKGGIIVHSSRLNAVTRASSDIDAVNDRFVAKALSWIRENIDGSLRVESVANGICYPKHALQKKFKKALGNTIGSEIRRQRLELAMRLMRTTDKNISSIADICGFGSTSYLCKCIREATGQTPNHFRKE